MRIEHGDMREVLARLLADGVRVHSIVTDPPYHLTSIVKRFGSPTAKPTKADGSTGVYKRSAAGFMGQTWDGGDIAFDQATWRLCYDLLPPGGHLLAFSGTRTYHRMACAIEDAGFEIRDTIAWLYGSGFPKSHNVSRAIDRAAGVEREETRAGKVNRGGYGEDWDTANSATRPRFDEPVTDEARAWNGWGTALKPAMEPICVARKPIDGTVAANVLKHGTGALNINACKIRTGEEIPSFSRRGEPSKNTFGDGLNGTNRTGETSSAGRWPANVCHDGSDEVVKSFPTQSGGGTPPNRPAHENSYGGFDGQEKPDGVGASSGNASRFFYSAKADSSDRLGSKHPTVKPVDLMRWLVKLVTPKGGTVLDPFAGSGATGMACLAEGIDCILVEQSADYVADIRRRLAHVKGDDTPLFSHGGNHDAIGERSGGTSEGSAKSDSRSKKGRLAGGKDNEGARRPRRKRSAAD